jgi:ribosomal protein S18 acetylase RimI-like enzyme
VIIRRATSADAAALAALARETFVDAFGADNRPEDMEAYTRAEFSEALQRREIEDPDILTLLADRIAYAQLRRTPGSPHGEVELARFYVHRAHHGRGLAQTLMSSVIDHARALGATRLWLGVWERNARAIAFYRKCGFEQCATQPFLLGSDLQTDWVMSRTNL